MRNTSIEFLRFLFISIIVIYHFGGVFPNGYLGVEFFFILSGFLLYRSCQIKHLLPIYYLSRKIKRFYLKYIVALGIIFLLKFKIWLTGDIVDNILRLIAEMLFLQNIGFYSGGYNTPCWYLSVLIVGGTILYSLLFFYKNATINIIIPISVVFTYSYLFSLSPSFNVLWEGVLPLLRGCAAMGIGVITAYVYEAYNHFFARNKHFLNYISFICLICSLYFCLTINHYDKYVILCFPILIIQCFIENSLLNRLFSRDIWRKLGSFSFEMFLIHGSVIMVIDKFLTLCIGQYWKTSISIVEKIFVTLLYFIVLISLSYLFRALCRKFERN